jgi:death-on-curing protein
VTVEYLDLVDYLAIAVAVTGLDVTTLSRIADLTLADSALHAPGAGFGSDDLYPDFVDKAAVLITRLAKNHALPDGNKRTAWVALRMFIEINGWEWSDYPSVDEAEAAVLAITAGEWTEAQAADWLRSRIAARLAWLLGHDVGGTPGEDDE